MKETSVSFDKQSNLTNKPYVGLRDEETTWPIAAVVCLYRTADPTVR